MKRLVRCADELGLGELYCADLDAGTILEVETMMRSEGLAEATISSGMATLWSVISWGADHELLPDIRRPRKRRTKEQRRASQPSKGRSLTLEEIDRMEAAIPRVLGSPQYAEGYLRAMRAMRLIGLRRRDAWLFSWIPEDGRHYPIGLETSTPSIVFSSEQKSGKDETIPLTPEAAVWIATLPRDASEWICRTEGPRGPHRTPDRLGRVISEAGKLAGIVVKRNVGRNPDGTPKTKFASAHDLRRTFAATWHSRGLSVKQLQLLTRHADPMTLLRGYADAQSEDLLAKLNRYASNVEASLDSEVEPEI